MYASDIEIHPNQGWANVQLGSPLEEVRSALATNGHAYDLDSEEWTIDIYDPKITFTFDNSDVHRLVQIVFYDRNHRIQDQQVIGLTLAEALLPLEVESYDDTIWSLVSIEEEYQKGVPLPDSRRLRKSSSTQNLDCATLWIKSQGVGLVMLLDEVHAVAIRKRGSEPKVGCGPLDSKTMALALEVQPAQKNAPKKLRIPLLHSPSQKPQKSIGLRFVWLLLSALFFIVPIGSVYYDLTQRNQFETVVGKVVATKPEGPFPDWIDVAFIDANGLPHEVSIPDTYTTARELEDEVELVYRPSHPEQAMTRIQSRDNWWGIPPTAMVICIGIAMFFLHMAFPNHIRLNSRRRP